MSKNHIDYSYTVSIILDKTLKGTRVVCNSMTERFFRALGPRTEHFERFFVLQQTINSSSLILINYFAINMIH